MNTVSSTWDWTRQTLLPGLHPGLLYDGLQSEPYIADRMSLQLGVARLRQVRVQKGTSPFGVSERQGVAIGVSVVPLTQVVSS